jgi:hypothetical protein
MKKYTMALIPTLAVIVSVLLVTVFSPIQSHPQPPQQQQQNQPTQQQPLQTNGTDNNDNKLDNHSPSIVSILPL